MGEEGSGQQGVGRGDEWKVGIKKGKSSKSRS